MTRQLHNFTFRVPRRAPLVLALAALALAAPNAHAASGISQFQLTTSASQAGGHPDIGLHASFFGRTSHVQPPGSCNCHDVEKLTVHFPTGVVAIPGAAPSCTAADFSLNRCPPDTQIGVAYGPRYSVNGLAVGIAPIFNMAPDPDQVGLLAFEDPLLIVPLFTVLSTRTGSDFGLDASTGGIPHLQPLTYLDYDLWGIPASSSHDALRFPSGADPCPGDYPDASGCFTPTPASVPPAPFIENATTCGGAPRGTLDAYYYDLFSHWVSSPWPAADNCDQLSFNPSLIAQPTMTAASSPSGIDIGLRVPQDQSAGTPSPSEIRAARIDLPDGFVINPSGLDGKSVCTDAEAGFDGEGPAACPETAKVGTLSLESSALPGPIGGAVYLGEPQPGDRYRLFLAADGYATHIKLPASLAVDSQSGQLTISLADLPQYPLAEIAMHLFGSERGLFATPSHCGTYPVHTELVPWDAALGDQVSQTAFTIDSGPDGAPCPAPGLPFSPHFAAGSTSYSPGQSAPFGLEVSREIDQQGLSGFALNLPPGLTASLQGIPYCTQVESCLVQSRIGGAIAAFGLGSHPLYLQGDVYLAGPYEGAPLSLEVTIPARVGPYDLGDLAIRAAIEVDPSSGRVSLRSDPLPQMLDGVHLGLRMLRISFDRPGFALGPTDCDPFAIGATLSSDQGSQAARSVHYQLANCAELGFAPKLFLRLVGAKNRGARPALEAALKTSPDDANLAAVTLNLPASERIDWTRTAAGCTSSQLASDQCPADSALGSATVLTPLLDAPLTGTVYLLAGAPTELAVALHGQVAIDLRGTIDAVNGVPRVSLRGLPDLPVTSFELNLSGGRQGLIVNRTNFCKVRRFGHANLAGQNGKRESLRLSPRPSCAKARHRIHLARARRVGGQ